MHGMTTPSFRLPWPALRDTTVHEMVRTLRGHAERLQGHPVVARVRAFRFTLPALTVAAVAVCVVVMFLWAQLAYLSGKLILGNLLMLALGWGAVFTLVLVAFLSLALLTGTLRLRGE